MVKDEREQMDSPAVFRFVPQGHPPVVMHGVGGGVVCGQGLVSLASCMQKRVTLRSEVQQRT